MLNVAKGNMYEWATHTWNPIKGKCPHDCSYCYMKKWGIEMKPARLVGAEFKTDLETGNAIFVGSSCDMWAANIPTQWIKLVLDHCREYSGNKYIFQSKNPVRFLDDSLVFPKDTLFGTTIESDQWHSHMQNSPAPIKRAQGMIKLRMQGYEVFVTIEPVMKFYRSGFVDMIRAIKPSFVNIGANTNSKVALEEPSPTKLQTLIDQLSEFTEIRKKSNLSRLLQAG